MADSNSTRRRPSFKDLTGKQFGKWTVIEEAINHPSTNVYWTCRCECGTEQPIQGGKLTGNHTHGCNTCARWKHGMTGTSEFNTWRAMHQRCDNPNHNAFHNYGDKGITVCERWKSFENFYADMGPKPSASHSVDRIDVMKGYSPENCRWATMAEQARNKRTNRLVTFNGKTMCLADWSVEVGLSFSIIWYRLSKGWPVDLALTQPAKKRNIAKS